MDHAFKSKLQWQHSGTDGYGKEASQVASVSVKIHVTFQDSNGMLACEARVEGKSCAEQVQFDLTPDYER